jgi:hypothetical protein
MDDDSTSQRIHVPKTSEIVADKIRAQIIRGELNEGDSLPPEGSSWTASAFRGRLCVRRSAFWKPKG